MKMLLIVGLIAAVDLVAIGSIREDQEQWTLILCWVWLLWLSLAAGLVGGLQSLGWVTFGSAWAKERRSAGIRGGLEVLGGKHGWSRAGTGLLRLLSGSCLCFALLSQFLKMAIFNGWLEGWDPRLVTLLLIHWFRLSALGLAGLFWAPILFVVARGALVHAVLAAAGSLTGWYVLQSTLGLPPDQLWQLAVQLMAWFPTYGYALLWGGALWWLPSRLAGRSDTR